MSKLSKEAAEIENHDFYPFGYEVEEEGDGYIVVGCDDMNVKTALTWPMSAVKAEALVDELNEHGNFGRFCYE